MGSIVRLLLVKLDDASLPWMKDETCPVTINRIPKRDLGNLILNVLLRLLEPNWIKSSASSLRSGPVESAPSSVCLSVLATSSFHRLPQPPGFRIFLMPATQTDEPSSWQEVGSGRSLTLHSEDVWRSLAAFGLNIATWRRTAANLGMPDSQVHSPEH